MTNTEKKFKERAPEETVELIRAFFEGLGFQTEHFCERSDVGTHYCKVDLFYKGILVLDTNGKGMTQAYSVASGYGELYERFCNQVNFLYNPFWCGELTERRRRERGYSIDPEEREVSDEEAADSPIYASMMSSMFRTKEQRLRALRIMLGSAPVTEVPYTDFVTGEKVYADPRLLLRIDRSKGCAAGNTPAEAFNQSLSELFEATVETDVMMGRLDRFVRVSDKYLSRFPELYAIIEAVRAQGNELYVLDFGAVTGLPVLCSVAIQKETGAVAVDFGSFPVFEIALERVLTELYQGKRTIRDLSKAMRPWREAEKYAIAMEGANNITGAGAYPSGMFLDVPVEPEPARCFLTGDPESNEAVCDYMRRLCREKGMHVCWRDESLCPDVAAVRLFILGGNCFDTKGGAYSRAGSVFVTRNLDLMERYVQQCYAIVEGRTDARQVLDMARRFTGIDGRYVGAVLNGEYLDFRFTRVPVLTYAIMSVLEGNAPDLGAEHALGKPAAMLRLCRTFDRGEAGKLLALCGGELDVDRLLDQDYLYRQVILEPLLDSHAFMRELAGAFPIR